MRLCRWTMSVRCATFYVALRQAYITLAWAVYDMASQSRVGSELCCKICWLLGSWIMQAPERRLLRLVYE